MVYFHGNGEVVAEGLGLAAEMAPMGVGVFLAEYRGYGGSDGTPALAGMLDDVPAIHEATGREPGDVVVFGRSVGSIYAVEYARRYPGIAGLILESGIHDVLQRLLLRLTPEELGGDFGDLEAAVRARCDHAAKLAGYTGPLLVLHAENDSLVGVEHGRANFAAAAGPEKRLVVFERGDHNTILGQNWDGYWGAVREFLRG